MLRATNRAAEAERLLRRAVEILESFERDTGHRHPDHPTIAENLDALELEMHMRAEQEEAAGTAVSATTAPHAASGSPPKAAKATFLNWMFGRL